MIAFDQDGRNSQVSESYGFCQDECYNLKIQLILVGVDSYLLLYSILHPHNPHTYMYPKVDYTLSNSNIGCHVTSGRLRTLGELP